MECEYGKPTVALLDLLDDVDEEFLENIATYGKCVTGIDNVIYISPAPRSKSRSSRRSEHGPEAG